MLLYECRLRAFFRGFKTYLGRTSDLQTTLTKILIDFEEPPYFRRTTIFSTLVDSRFRRIVDFDPMSHHCLSYTDSVVSRAVQQGIGLDDPPENFSVFAHFSFSYFLHIFLSLLFMFLHLQLQSGTHVFSVFPSNSP